MFRRAKWIIAAGSAIALLFAAPPAQAADQASDVRVALRAMHRWVGADANGESWRRHLKSAELEEQLSQGSAADRAIVAEIHSIYTSPTPGLDSRRFVAVRDSLSRWIIELDSDRPERLAELVASMTNEFREIPESEVHAARRRVISSMNELERFLGRGSNENEAAWKKFLNWDAAAESLGADSADLTGLRRSFARYFQDEAGLELPQFSRVRDGMVDYMNLATVAARPEPREFFEQQLELLAPRLTKLVEDPDSETARVVGQILFELERSGQTPELVAAVRRHYWQPNLYASVSDRVMVGGISDTVDQVSEIRENIMGTSIFGTAHMQGTLSARLVPSPTQASFDILLNGRALSDNVGYNRGVTIDSTGVTEIAAAKRLWVDAEGLHERGAVAECTTRTNILAIGHRMKMIQRAAWRRADKTLPDAERIASRRAEARVEEQMDEQAEELLADAIETYNERFKNRLRRRAEFPRLLSFATTKNAVSVKMLQANASQLAATSVPPEIADGQDLSVRLHESFVSNFSRAILGGVTLTDERLEQLLEEMTGDVPEELRIGPDKDPWSITFESRDPVSATFTTDRVRFAIRGRRFTQGDYDPVESTIELAASYQLERTDEGAHLTRIGDVQVDFIGAGDTLSPRQIAVRTLLRRKFEALFATEFATEGLTLPGRWENVGILKLQQMISDRGWLALAWKQPPVAKVARAD